MTGSVSYQTLANVVLGVHVGFVVFVVLGLLLIVSGNWLGWRWVNNPWFRLAHLATILIVVAEAWLGIICPLTALEMWLRRQGGASSYAGSFIEYWLRSVLYFDLPPWVFIIAYSLFAALILACYWVFPPRFKRNQG